MFDFASQADSLLETEAPANKQRFAELECAPAVCTSSCSAR